MRLFPKRWWLRITILLLAVLVVPYAYSRIASPWRCVTVHSNDKNRSAIHAPTEPLRIACYNIAHGRGVAESNWQGGTAAERLARLDQIAELLRKIDADVVVLNEVDFDASWSGSTNQARYLAEKAGYAYWVEQRNVDVRVLFWTWKFGNAVLSKHPIADARVVDLPGDAAWETALAGKKRAVVCDVALGDRTVRVIAAHLSHRSEAVRVRSAEMIAEIAERSKPPTFVAGDLNSTPPGFPQSNRDSSGENAMETLLSSGYFQELPLQPPVASGEFTFHSLEPTRVIDWILIPRDWRYLEYVVEGGEFSDHRAVWGAMFGE